MAMKGKINPIAQKKETLPKLWCQKCGARSGKAAIDNKIPANGITQKIFSSLPSRCGIPACVFAAPNVTKGIKIVARIIFLYFFIK